MKVFFTRTENNVSRGGFLRILFMPFPNSVLNMLQIHVESIGWLLENRRAEADNVFEFIAVTTGIEFHVFLVANLVLDVHGDKATD